MHKQKRKRKRSVRVKQSQFFCEDLHFLKSYQITSKQKHTEHKLCVTAQGLI